jgi:hypothetical protein
MMDVQVTGSFTVQELQDMAVGLLVLDSSEGIRLGKERECPLTQWQPNCIPDRIRYYVFLDSWKECNNNGNFFLLGLVVQRYLEDAIEQQQL